MIFFNNEPFMLNYFNVKSAHQYCRDVFGKDNELVIGNLSKNIIVDVFVKRSCFISPTSNVMSW